MSNTEEDIRRRLDKALTDDDPLAAAGLCLLLAQHRQLLARDVSVEGAQDDTVRFEGSPIIYHLSGVIEYNGEHIPLSPYETTLMDFLAQRPYRHVAKEDIYEHVWGGRVNDPDSSFRSLLCQLRIRIEPDPHNPIHIITSRHSGTVCFDPVGRHVTSVSATVKSKK